MLKLNTEMIEPFVAPEDLKKAKADAAEAFDTLVSGPLPEKETHPILCLQVTHCQRTICPIC